MFFQQKRLSIGNDIGQRDFVHKKLKGNKKAFHSTDRSYISSELTSYGIEFQFNSFQSTQYQSLSERMQMVVKLALETMLILVKSPGRFNSKQFVIPTSANHNSLDEYLADKFNTSNKNAKRNDSIKRSLFADNLMNTKPNQLQNNKIHMTEVTYKMTLMPTAIEMT